MPTGPMAVAYPITAIAAIAEGRGDERHRRRVYRPARSKAALRAAPEAGTARDSHRFKLVLRAQFREGPLEFQAGGNVGDTEFGGDGFVVMPLHQQPQGGGLADGEAEIPPFSARHLPQRGDRRLQAGELSGDARGQDLVVRAADGGRRFFRLPSVPRRGSLLQDRGDGGENRGGILRPRQETDRPGGFRRFPLRYGRHSFRPGNGIKKHRNHGRAGFRAQKPQKRAAFRPGRRDVPDHEIGRLRPCDFKPFAGAFRRQQHISPRGQNCGEKFEAARLIVDDKNLWHIGRRILGKNAFRNTKDVRRGRMAHLGRVFTES